MVHDGGTYREGSHSKGVNIALHEAFPQKPFWSHIPDGFQLGVVPWIFEHARETKVSEACLAIPGDQDVVLGVKRQRVGSLFLV